MFSCGFYEISKDASFYNTHEVAASTLFKLGGCNPSSESKLNFLAGCFHDRNKYNLLSFVTFFGIPYCGFDHITLNWYFFSIIEMYYALKYQLIQKLFTCWWLHDPGLTRPAGADFNLRWHGEIKFHTGKVGKFSTGCFLDLFTFYFSFLLKALLNYFFIPLAQGEAITWENFVPSKRYPVSTKEGFHLAGKKLFKCNRRT